MRLLVFDEAIIWASAQMLCVNLLPALSQFCEILVWVVPNYLRPEFATCIDDAPSLLLEGHNWPRWSPRCLPQRLLRRANPSLSGAMGQAAARSLRNARIRALAKKYRCTHFLTSRIFDQPLPDLELPLFGFVYDVPAVGEVRLNITRWLAKAQGIFGISEFIRQELQRVQPSQAGKIHAVPLAAPELKNWNPKPPAARQYDFYYPAAAIPHKNHLVLFQACTAIARRGWRFRLALSGAGTDGFRVEGGFTGGFFASSEMEEARRFLHDHASLLDRRVEVIGEVALTGVHTLYEDTRAVVLPSAYEGFGFPLAEALQRGLTVICSDIPAFREQLAVFGRPGNVQIVPANDAVLLAAAMEDFLKCAPDATRNQKPATNIRRWTWQDAAQRCFELLSTGTA